MIGAILIFGGKFLEPYDHIRIIFEKIVRRIKNLVNQSFSYLSAIYVKWDQKPKRVNQKMKNVKNGVCRVLTSIRKFFLAHQESDAKNRLEIVLGQVGPKTSFKNDD